ncbi:MAG: type II and III secretion system protein family protein [Proteobacteria bacterium]|nr:type II and III secretion system protein family protein [Pseudomonadota bacterium]
MNNNNKLIVSLAAALLSATGVLQAADTAEPVAQPPQSAAPTARLPDGGSVDLFVPLFKSRIVSVPGGAHRVSVGSPDIADIVVISPTQIYVLGKDIGTTNVLLWDGNNHLIGTIGVEVQHDLEDLKRKLSEILPGEAIEVRSTQRSIVLSGHVDDIEKMNAAVRIAEAYRAQIQSTVNAEVFKQQNNSPRPDKTVGEVINLISVGGVQQVMLEVKVAEITRTEVRSLDAKFNSFRQGGNWNWGGVNGGATFPPFKDAQNLMYPTFNPTRNGWGPPVDTFMPNPLSIVDQGLFASFFNQSFLFKLALDAAKNTGMAKILAEPTLTTLTGQEAKFLSGGQFPIPVAASYGNVTVDYKDFGVGLTFIPVVLSNGHINLKLNVSVSDLVDTNVLGVSVANANSTFVIPSLSTRSASGTVELGDGQTIGLAGLLSENLRQSVNKFPGLGSVPVLGALFRSQNYQKGNTELVILVTPHLAKPLPKDKIKLPTDSLVEPSDADFYIWGRMQGDAKPAEQR